MDESFDDDFSASLPSTLSKVVQTTVLCPAFVANLFGNICVCLAVARIPSLKQRPNTPFLASLALTDLSFSSFLLFRLIWLYDFEAASKVCEFFAMIICTHSLVTVIHICLLSYDRYVAIANPLRYRSIMTTKRVKRVLTAAWFALLVGKIILPFSYRSNSSTQFRRSMISCLDSAAENKLSFIHITNIAFNITFLMALPLAVTVFVYIRIAKISWTLSNQLEPGEYLNPEKAELRRRRRKEMKWMKTIGKKNPYMEILKAKPAPCKRVPMGLTVRQPSNGLNVNRQPSKRVIFYHQQSKTQIDSFKEFQSCFLVFQLMVMDFRLLKNPALNWKTSSHVLRNTPSRHYKTLELAYA